MGRKRLSDLGISIGEMPVGQWNAITDVAGVKVGYHHTCITDDPNVLRTGVTAICPRGDEIWNDAVFAGYHSFNGYGEMTGLPWIAEQGLIHEPIAITNTYSVGVVRDAICTLASREMKKVGPVPLYVNMPFGSETCDAFLNDMESQGVTADMAFEALANAISGPIAEGNVGGGTGMMCHEFKGWTGTSSRITPAGHTVGVLVQANYGRREHFRVDGVPVGQAIGGDAIPSPDGGSIVVIIATDAP